MEPIKALLRPAWRRFYKSYEETRIRLRTFSVPLDKLLCGGNNGIRAAKYAQLTGDFLLPSRLAIISPHVKLLDDYEREGEKLFQKEIFEKTEYYQHFATSIDLTGSNFYDRKEKIIDVARTFVDQFRGVLNTPASVHPGQSECGAPVWLRPIKNSSYYEVIDGHHRIALAHKNKENSVKALVYYPEPVHTPLQELLLDVLWINKNKWLYQPIVSPELSEEWVLIRKCTDRLAYMQTFLEQQGWLPPHKNKLTYLDVGSSYGWFVNEMLQRGFEAYGVERDRIAIEVGEKFYHLDASCIRNMEIGNYLENTQESYDVVSCMSVLHHFILHKNSTDAVSVIKNLDRITKKVLFIDTAQNHEEAFSPLLPEWDDAYIARWITSHTSFTKVIPLGRDDDRVSPFESYYNRTFFACIRDSQ